MVELIMFSHFVSLVCVLLISTLYFGNGLAAVSSEHHRLQPPWGKIIKGKPANYGGDEGHPYLVSLQVLVYEDKHSYYYEHACGASVIDHITIITAAHCFLKHPNPRCWVDKSNVCYRIVAGKYDMAKEFPEKEQIISVSSDQITIHEDYDDFHYDNDIALIHLEQPLKFNDYVKPISLLDSSINYENTTGIIAGWGHNLEGKPMNILRETNVTIFSDDHCFNQWGDDYHRDFMLCAGGTEGNGLVADACWGDSGGPLVVREETDPSKKYILGLISWGFECGYKEYPGLYTRLQTYLNWIKEKRFGWIKRKRRHLRLRKRLLNQNARSSSGSSPISD